MTVVDMAELRRVWDARRAAERLAVVERENGRQAERGTYAVNLRPGDLAEERNRPHCCPPCAVHEPGEDAQALAALSRWVDEANAHRDPEAATWGRLAKVAEEDGEVIAAFIAATGQNPRKGTSGSMDDVTKELLDVAVTALCAVEHLTGNVGKSIGLFSEHARRLVSRAGLGAALSVAPQPEPDEPAKAER